MNCQNCGFYCYDDEYICPNCETLLDKEIPIDKDERALFISNQVIELKERKRAVRIIKLWRRALLVVFISSHFIFGWWLDTFITYPTNRIDPYQNTARWSIVLALPFYIILLGKPRIPSNKPYMEGNKFNIPIGLIKKGSIKKGTYLILILLIFIATYIFYLLLLKKMMLSGFIYWPSTKLESFGLDKLAKIIDIKYFIEALGIGIFYAMHSIYNITDADYYILERIGLHKKNK